jgi:hypothetical protein
MIILLSIIAIEIGSVIAFLVVKNNLFDPKKVRIVKHLIRDYQTLIMENELTARFLREYEINRLENIVSYQSQKLDERKARLKSGINDEKTKIRVKRDEERLEEYKGAIIKNKAFADSMDAKNNMLNAKIVFYKRTNYSRNQPKPVTPSEDMEFQNTETIPDEAPIKTDDSINAHAPQVQSA